LWWWRAHHQTLSGLADLPGQLPTGDGPAIMPVWY